jgi:RNA polymerase sigma-70 factor (ECF subfamily)
MVYGVEGVPPSNRGQDARDTGMPLNRGRDARDTREGPLETLVCNEQLETLSGALAELPFEQREILMLHLHGQMTFRAIAQARQISTNTAKSRYRYGIDKLRSILEGKVS